MLRLRLRLRHPNRRPFQWWFDFTAPNGDYLVGLCTSRAEAKREARLFGGTYQGRWLEGGR